MSAERKARYVAGIALLLVVADFLEGLNDAIVALMINRFVDLIFLCIDSV